MADAENPEASLEDHKIQLEEHIKTLEEHKRKLEEMQQRYGSPEAQVHPEHVHSMKELIASTERTVQTLIELLGRVGL